MRDPQLTTEQLTKILTFTARLTQLIRLTTVLTDHDEHDQKRLTPTASAAISFRSSKDDQ